MTTILKPDGSFTANLNVTMQVMLETTDDQSEDTEYHKSIREQIKELIQTADDRDLTPVEVKNAIEGLTNKKGPGEDGITGAIYKRVYEIFPY